VNARSLILYAWPSRVILVENKNNNMSQSQYLKMLEREINKINKQIDLKILKGLDYRREARNHKLLLKRVRYHTQRTLGQRLIHLFFQKNIYA